MIVIICLLLLFLYYIFLCFNNKEKFNVSPSYTDDFFKEQQVDINLVNYKKFLEERKEIDELLKKYNETHNTDMNFGISELRETDEDTLGFCPIGQYYNKREDEDFQKKGKNLENCKICSKCNDGEYISGGCLGDRDTICTYGNVPLELYIKGHKKLSFFHNSLHKHKHIFKQDEEMLESSNNHNH
tara:strand:+ start:264 stop:821 length:558 start_codon:yes stop_codon:yes gene_type:complete